MPLLHIDSFKHGFVLDSLLERLCSYLLLLTPFPVPRRYCHAGEGGAQREIWEKRLTLCHDLYPIYFMPGLVGVGRWTGVELGATGTGTGTGSRAFTAGCSGTIGKASICRVPATMVQFSVGLRL